MTTFSPDAVQVVEYRGCLIATFPLGSRTFAARISEGGREWLFPWHRSPHMGLPFVESRRQKTLASAKELIDLELQDRAVSEALGVEWQSPFFNDEEEA